jgi:hypothetical protein
MEKQEKPPFSQGYVLRTTAKHMRKSIDISIRKTFDRKEEFVDNPEKAMEVFQTLSILHTMRKQLDEFQAHHKEDFRGS